MSPRNNKPPVPPGKPQAWLERHEKGESIPQIAAADGYDKRTVRGHIEKAQQKREADRARATVLTNSLERHYAQLCACAESLIARSSGWPAMEFGAHSPVPLEHREHLERGLNEHLPKARFWRLLKQRTKLETDKEEILSKLSKQIHAALVSDRALSDLGSEEQESVVAGLSDAFTQQAQQWAHGAQGLSVEHSLKAKPDGKGVAELSYGAFGLGKIREEDAEIVRKAIIGWTRRIKEWSACKEFVDTIDQLGKTQEDLQDEVAVIVLRGVLPGRCQYCPL